METSFTLTSAGNTDNPSLFLLQQKGYRLERIIEGDRSQFAAYKDGRGFLGSSGSELLGLVTLWERLGDSWREKALAMPDLLDEIPTTRIENE